MVEERAGEEPSVGWVDGRALPMRVCASVQASETDGMDPKGKVMTVYSGQHAG